MSENLIVREGGIGRRLGPISRVITDDASDGNDTWVPASDRITLNKYVSENGVYYAEDDGLYAFSKLTVNIMGAPTAPEIPTEAVDEFGPEIPTGASGPDLPQGIGGIGASIVGVDPISGNYCVVGVKKDANGNNVLTKKEIPTKLHILTLPPDAYLIYESNQEIKPHGLLVELQKEDGTTFTDERFGYGTILWNPVPWQGKPWEEEMIYDNLALNPTVAPNYDSFEAVYSDNPFSSTAIPVLSVVKGKKQASAGGHGRWYDFAYYKESWAVGMVVVTGKPLGDWRTFLTMINATADQSVSGPNLSYTYNGKRVRYAYGTWMDNHNVTSPHLTSAGMSYAQLAWSIVYGELSAREDVEVSWKSPYDGNTYKTEFEIKIVPSTSSSASGSGGSSTSGGGGGGGGNGGGGAG